MQLAGRVAIVTGASRGLGKAIAAAFVGQGADVMLVARDLARLRRAADDLIPLRPKASQKVLVQSADVSRSDEVAQVVRVTLDVLGGVDVLVCNAAVQGPIGPLEDLAWVEWMRTIEINLFGTVLFCQAVLPTMRRKKQGKIILLSGGGATRARPRFSAYAASKAAVVRFAETLGEELADSGVDVNAVAPGTLDTELLDLVVQAGPERAGEAEFAEALRGRTEAATPFDVPARLVTFLASSASDGISGRLLSAVWDDWADLPDLHKRLEQPDAYTLRRVVPAAHNQGVA